MSWSEGADCWGVLALAPTQDMGAIRRAYALRTRQCHPEDDPAGFQRLHEAFQAALAWARCADAPRPSSATESPPPEPGPDFAALIAQGMAREEAEYRALLDQLMEQLAAGCRQEPAAVARFWQAQGANWCLLSCLDDRLFVERLCALLEALSPLTPEVRDGVWLLYGFDANPFWSSHWLYGRLCALLPVGVGTTLPRAAPGSPRPEGVGAWDCVPALLLEVATVLLWLSPAGPLWRWLWHGVLLGWCAAQGPWSRWLWSRRGTWAPLLPSRYPVVLLAAVSTICLLFFAEAGGVLPLVIYLPLWVLAAAAGRSGVLWQEDWLVVQVPGRRDRVLSWSQLTGVTQEQTWGGEGAAILLLLLAQGQSVILRGCTAGRDVFVATARRKGLLR